MGDRATIVRGGVLNGLLTVIACAVLAFGVLVPTKALAAAYDLGASGSCGENASYTFDSTNGRLEITVSDGAQTGRIDNEAFEGQQDVREVTIGEGITTIENWAFNGCVQLESVSLPASLERIAYHVFRDCDALQSVSYAGTMAAWAQVQIDDDNLPLNGKTITCSDGTATYVIEGLLPYTAENVTQVAIAAERPLYAGVDTGDYSFEAALCVTVTMDDGTSYDFNDLYGFEPNGEPYDGYAAQVRRLLNEGWYSLDGGVFERSWFEAEFEGRTDEPGTLSVNFRLNEEKLPNATLTTQTVDIDVLPSPVSALTVVGEGAMQVGVNDLSNTDGDAIQRFDLNVEYADGTSAPINDYGASSSSGFAYSDCSCSRFFLDTHIFGSDQKLVDEVYAIHSASRHGLRFETETDALEWQAGETHTVTVSYMGARATYDIEVVEGSVRNDDPDPEPERARFARMELDLAGTNLTYDGSPKEPQVTVYDVYGDVVDPSYYEVTYLENVNAGTATVEVEADYMAYTGFLFDTFEIAKAKQTIVFAVRSGVAGKSFALNAQLAKGDGALSYKSSKTSVATVDSSGMVSCVSAGSAQITVNAAETANYQAASKSFTLTVAAGATTPSPSADTPSPSGDASGKDPSSASSTTAKKKANTLTAKAKKKTVTVKYSKVKKKAQVLASNVKASKAKGAVSYSNASKDKTAKKFKINAKTGKITIPKKTKKGTYTVKIKVTAKGNGTYKSATKTVSFKVKVK